MADEWYYSRDGQQLGPISTEQVQAMVARGQITSDNVVWREGMRDWTPIGDLPQLAAPASSVATVAPLAAQPASGPLPYYGGNATAMAVTERAVAMLRQTRPWVRFISIIIFIMAGLMGVAGLIMFVVGVASVGRSSTAAMAPLALVYVAMACLYIAPGLYLGRYASRITSTLASGHPGELEAALEAQKSFWKFAGILTIVFIAVYLVVMLVAMIAAVMR